MWASDCFVFVICFTFSQLPEASVDSKSMWAKFDHVEWLLRLIASSLTYDKGWCGGFLKWSSISIGFSIIHYPFGGTIDGNLHVKSDDFQMKRWKVTMGYPSKPVKYHRIRSLKDILRRPWNQKNIALQSSVVAVQILFSPFLEFGNNPWG